MPFLSCLKRNMFGIEPSTSVTRFNISKKKELLRCHWLKLILTLNYNMKLERQKLRTEREDTRYDTNDMSFKRKSKTESMCGLMSQWRNNGSFTCILLYISRMRITDERKRIMEIKNKWELRWFVLLTWLWLIGYSWNYQYRMLVCLFDSRISALT